jgi:hypothetical protein
MLRIPDCLDSRLTDGGEVVSLTYWPRSTPSKIPDRISVRGRFNPRPIYIYISNDLIGIRTHDLLASNIA